LLLNNLFRNTDEISDYIDPNKPKYTMIDKECIDKKNADDYEGNPKMFERYILCYLHTHKDELGIKKVYKIENGRIDGILELIKGEVILIEIKYSLNWFESCNARIEFEVFLKIYNQNEKYPFKNKAPKRGLIIFSEFSKDWNDEYKKNGRKKGWKKFYEEEKTLRSGSDGIPIDIAQFDKEHSVLINLYSKK